MALTLYYLPTSSPCRAVLLTAKALGVELDLKTLDLMKGEHVAPEYLMLNPQHTIPTLVDDGLSLWESRAIITYLVNRYGKGSTLYPQEPAARALVDQRLYFDIGTLYQRFMDYMFPIMFLGLPADPKSMGKIEEALVFLNGFLEGQTYVAGPHLTVADLSLVASVSSLEIVNVDFQKYANIKKWYAHLKKTVPGYKEANEDGLDAYKAISQIWMKDPPMFYRKNL